MKIVRFGRAGQGQASTHPRLSWSGSSHDHRLSNLERPPVRGGLFLFRKNKYSKNKCRWHRDICERARAKTCDLCPSSLESSRRKRARCPYVACARIPKRQKPRTPRATLLMSRSERGRLFENVNQWRSQWANNAQTTRVQRARHTSRNGQAGGGQCRLAIVFSTSVLTDQRPTPTSIKRTSPARAWSRT